MGSEANNREKIFLIIDFEGFGMSLSSVSNLKTTKQVLGVLQNHFPGSLLYLRLSMHKRIM
jgi:hypothetical protein